MIIVVMTHNFDRETKTFSSMNDAELWADKNGFELVPTKSPTVFYAEF